MSSLRCKRCGNPISDAYSKWSYCAKCGKSKQRLDNMDVFFRAFAIISLSPIVVALIFSLANVASQLTLYWFISWQAILSFASLCGFFINKHYITTFDKSKA
ncbi:MAG: hypothetical protein E6L04_05940 [Thaumarchaeota archaeon]|nr:MAG: hypothetical protein E6L04_05940 [Nitrososphaerota archaeon]